MKKLISIIFTLISVVIVCFSLVGCGATVKVRGQYYTLSEAYDNGWLSVDDLESIACCYYDSYNFEENPYSGKFALTQELTVKKEAELKQAYLEQIVELPEGDMDRVHIISYFGTYNGNVVVRIRSDYIHFDPKIEEEFFIGGVLFKKYRWGSFSVYHQN